MLRGRRGAGGVAADHAPPHVDDPDREPDDDPREDLATFAERFKEAMGRWGEVVGVVGVLRIVGV